MSDGTALKINQKTLVRIGELNHFFTSLAKRLDDESMWPSQSLLNAVVECKELQERIFNLEPDDSSNVLAYGFTLPVPYVADFQFFVGGKVPKQEVVNRYKSNGKLPGFELWLTPSNLEVEHTETLSPNFCLKHTSQNLTIGLLKKGPELNERSLARMRITDKVLTKHFSNYYGLAQICQRTIMVNNAQGAKCVFLLPSLLESFGTIFSEAQIKHESEHGVRFADGELTKNAQSILLGLNAYFNCPDELLVTTWESVRPFEAVWEKVGAWAGEHVHRYLARIHTALESKGFNYGSELTLSDVRRLSALEPGREPSLRGLHMDLPKSLAGIELSPSYDNKSGQNIEGAATIKTLEGEQEWALINDEEHLIEDEMTPPPAFPLVFRDYETFEPVAVFKDINEANLHCNNLIELQGEEELEFVGLNGLLPTNQEWIDFLE